MEIMDIIISDRLETAPEENAKTKYLEFKNRQLAEENELLRAMLFEAIGNRIIVIREENLNREPRFRVDENLGGDVLLSRI